MASTSPILHSTQRTAHPSRVQGPGSVADRKSLRRIPALRGLSSRELEDVHKRMVHPSYRSGEVIWRTRGSLHFLGYVESGEVELETRVDGILVRATRLVAGDLLPRRVLQERRPHEMVIARAVTDVRLAILPEEQKKAAVKRTVRRGMGWLLPVMLLLLVMVLARDDLARIASGVFYLSATQAENLAVQNPRSLQLLQAAQKVDKGAAFAYNEEGYRRFLQNNPSGALASFNEAVNRDPANAPALNNLAVTDFSQGDLWRAADTLQRAVAAAPDNPIARYNLGITLMQLGKSSGALRAFQEAGFIDPQDARPLLQESDLYQQAGDFASAEQRARSAIQINPTNTPAYLLLGLALYHQGREADALVSFEEALMLEPRNRFAAFYQALILGHQKQYDAALPVLYELLSSSPDAAQTARILAEIDALYRYKAEPSAAGR